LRTFQLQTDVLLQQCHGLEVARWRGKVVVVVMTETKSKPVLSFMEALRALESMRAFMYANIVNIERLLFSLKRKGAAKQMRINDFLQIINANWT
jgi:hypothetical protein